MDIYNPYKLGIPAGARPQVELNINRNRLGRRVPTGMSDRKMYQENLFRRPFDPSDQFIDPVTAERYFGGQPQQSDVAIPKSAAAQYMDAMQRQRMALAESTRMQQGQIPQAQVPSTSRRVPTGMSDRKALAGTVVGNDKEQDGSFLSKLYADPSSARGKALQAAAATALQLSGYQDRPITTGQVLGAMMQSGMEAYEKAKPEEEGIEYKTVGDRLFKIYADGKHEIVGGNVAKPSEVKAEGPRVRTKDGKEIETVYDKYNNLYPAGAALTEENRLDPSQFNVVSQYSEMNVSQRKQGRTELRESEKAIKMIDSLASEIVKLDEGTFSRLKDNYITKLKTAAPDVFGNLSDEEIARQVASGKLTALVGASRLALFGPGVLTEAEAELARQVFVGDIDITNPEIALNNLWAIRQNFYEDYSDDVDYYLGFEGNKYNKYTGQDKFSWNSLIDDDGRVRLPSEQPSSSSSQTGQTGSGNTWSVVGE